MKILITNDDGIQARGLHALRRELHQMPETEVAVIAPDSNRSAAARSITTREPLWVEEIEFGDGTHGFATDGTPVDCVRFASLGLLEFQPELIVSGINHGSNLGDDITYSGTVAAALEGILLGVPSISVSQQSDRRELDFRFGREFNFKIVAKFTARLIADRGLDGLPERTLLNINCPAGVDGEVDGVEVTKLGKRIYRDKLELDRREGIARTRYRIYGDDPGYHHEDGTDFAAVASNRISVTPIHFDLTDKVGMENLRDWHLGDLLAPVGD